MNRSLLKKCVNESRLLLLACGLAVFGFGWMRVWIVSRLDMGSFSKVVEQLWDKYQNFSPVPLSQLLTYSGRVALTFEEPIVVLCISIWAIARGSDSVSGELGRGSMELVLAQPVSRSQVLLTHAAVTLTGLALLCLLAWLGVFAGIASNTVEEKIAPTWDIPFLGFELPNPLGQERIQRLPMSSKVDPGTFIGPTLNLFALGVCLAGLTTLASSWDRYRWRTIGIMVSLYVVQTALKILGMASEEFAWLLRFTMFSAYEPQVVASVAVHSPEELWSLYRTAADGQWHLGPVGYYLILCGIGVASYVAAVVIFNRRDLPAPV